MEIYNEFIHEEPELENEEIQETVDIESSVTLVDDLPVTENDSENFQSELDSSDNLFPFEELEKILNSQENVDYSDLFALTHEKMDSIILLNEKMVEHQLRIGNDVATILNVIHLFGIYLVARLFFKLLYDLIFKGI